MGIKETNGVKISPQAVKDYLIEVFDNGSTDIHDKAKRADVVEKIKETFPSKDWIEAQTAQVSEVDEAIASTRVKMKLWRKSNI